MSTGRAPTIVFAGSLYGRGSAICWKSIRAGVCYLLEVYTGGGLLFAGSLYGRGSAICWKSIRAGSAICWKSIRAGSAICWKWT